MRKLWILALVAATLAVATPANAAGGCDKGAAGTIIVGDGDAHSKTYYVEDRADGAIHVYEETNGRAGLQRGGADACTDHPEITPDSLLV